jgi:hypothetical protein
MMIFSFEVVPVSLQEFRLLSLEGVEFSNVIKLMRIQSVCIQQTSKVIGNLTADFSIINNLDFQEFLLHFYKFAMNQSGSEGFSKVMEYIQVYNYILLEKLLDEEVFMATEQLEIAAAYLEIVSRERKIKANQEFALLNQNICLLEEAQLKIIEILERLLSSLRNTQLEN